MDNAWTKQRCDGCQFYNPIDLMPNTEGWCRRNPEYIKRQFNDWCGEYREKDGSEILHD